MNSGLSGKRALRRSLSVVTGVTLLSALVFGQQTRVPGVTAPAAEEEEIRRYSVELIIFEHVDRASAGTEVFLPDEQPGREVDSLLTATNEARSSDAPMPAVRNENAGLEETPTYEEAGLTLLGPEEYLLDDVYGHLRRLDAYRPIMRTAWIQATYEKDVTLPVTLRRLGNPPLRLDGTVTLYLGRYLHLVIDLSLEEKAPQRMPATGNRLRRFGGDRSDFRFDSEFIQPSIFYRISEDRIVRSGELRYYDHPRFGVVAKISRVEP